MLKTDKTYFVRLLQKWCLVHSKKGLKTKKVSHLLGENIDLTFFVNRYSRTKYSSFALFNQNPSSDEEWSLHEHNLINIGWSSSWATSWNSEIDHYIYIYMYLHWDSIESLEPEPMICQNEGTVVRIQIDLEAKTVVLLEARKPELTMKKRFVLSFFPIGREKRTSFVDQWRCELKQKRCNFGCFKICTAF